MSLAANARGAWGEVTRGGWIIQGGGVVSGAEDGGHTGLGGGAVGGRGGVVGGVRGHQVTQTDQQQQPGQLHPVTREHVILGYYKQD